jgi:hypothetical protein
MVTNTNDGRAVMEHNLNPYLDNQLQKHTEDMEHDDT